MANNLVGIQKLIKMLFLISSIRLFHTNWVILLQCPNFKKVKIILVDVKNICLNILK